MNPLEKIMESDRITVHTSGADGGTGFIHFSTWRGSVVWSTGGGWDHVSVAPFAKRITPSWDEMCKIKDIFFPDDEPVIQIHPRKSDYVNNVENCLHLWRYQGDMPLPPSWMVGVADGKKVRDVMEAARKELS